MKAYWTSAEVLLNFIGYLGKLALLVGCISVSIQIILILTYYFGSCRIQCPQ